MPGIALGIPDDLSHGPLDDGRARIGYMGERFRGYDDWYLDLTDAFAPWRAMIAMGIATSTGAWRVWDCGDCFCTPPNSSCPWAKASRCA